MRLDNRTRIAVTALIYVMLAKQKPTTLQQLSDLLGVSVSYLEQIFTQLRTAGIVAGERGPGGGYLLAKPAAEISIAAIAQAIDRGPAEARGNTPADESWRALGQRARGFFDGITLDTCAQVPNG